MGMDKILPHLLQFLFSILHKCVWKSLPYLITCRLIFKQVKPEKNSSYLQNQTRMWMKAYMHNLLSTDLGFVVLKGSKVSYLTRVTGLLHLMMMIPWISQAEAVIQLAISSTKLSMFSITSSLSRSAVGFEPNPFAISAKGVPAAIVEKSSEPLFIVLAMFGGTTGNTCTTEIKCKCRIVDMKAMMFSWILRTPKTC